MSNTDGHRTEDEEGQVSDQEEKGKKKAPSEEVEDDVRRRAVEKVAALRAARKAELDQLLTELEKVRSQKEKEMEKWRRQEARIAQLSQQLASGVSLMAEEEDEVDSFCPVLVDSFRQPSPSSRRAKRRRVAPPANTGEAGPSNVVGGATDTSDGELESSESSDEPEEKEGSKKRKRAGGSKGNAEETKKVKGQLIQVVKDRSYFIHPERQCEHCVWRKNDCWTPKDDSYACLDCKRGSVKCSARTGDRPVKRAAGNAPRPRKAKAKGKRAPKSEVGETEGPEAESLWDSLFRLRYHHSQDREVMRIIAEGLSTAVQDQRMELWLRMTAIDRLSVEREYEELSEKARGGVLGNPELRLSLEVVTRPKKKVAKAKKTKKSEEEKEENAPEGPEEIANLEVIPEDGDDGGELADAINMSLGGAPMDINRPPSPEAPKSPKEEPLEGSLEEQKKNIDARNACKKAQKERDAKMAELKAQQELLEAEAAKEKEEEAKKAEELKELLAVKKEPEEPSVPPPVAPLNIIRLGEGADAMEVIDLVSSDKEDDKPETSGENKDSEDKMDE
ncbi:hypothetical protein C8R45DRAFT_1097947 [Mycena sanguinolenta]|nr:hypothetical protein C8R45DRAFT_1097947 [Mycena sanguinolenta]